MSFWGTELLHHLSAVRNVVIWDPPAQGLSTEAEPSTEPVTVDVLQQASGPGWLAAGVLQPSDA